MQAMLHEMAYAVFDVLQVPVWGREADAADKLAGFERKILHPMELLVTLIEPQKESDKVAKDAEDAEVEADVDALKRSKKEASSN